jgi:hypothetical protein
VGSALKAEANVAAERPDELAIEAEASRSVSCKSSGSDCTRRLIAPMPCCTPLISCPKTTFRQLVSPALAWDC